ncbi:type I methionyl aminopeptidase [Propionicicella superfundia]|uniref:type I methionyl aminopeptidase n=1 Tax=Propionicicella superfundia TaxID=348582 RepID=UPI00040A4656|nr:type I methionyl aminopeptidase [Propionicicella superfundia]
MSRIKPYPLTPRRSVPATIARPDYVDKPAPQPYTGSHVQTPETIERMREVGRIAARAMHEAAKAVAPGVTTDKLDAVAHEYALDHGAYPSALGYRGFPKSICTSVNEVICHGIPDTRPLEDGDLVKIDVTLFKDGVHGDNCATFFCGDVPAASRDLAERTKEAMNRGIRAVRPGRRVNVIGRVIESYAKRFGYGVIRDYTGHGVHSAFHSGLVIPHYDDPRYDTVIEEGMTFTIEPMLTLGGYDWEVWRDKWTVVTADRSRVAQFEQSLVVTADGAEVLTVP